MPAYKPTSQGLARAMIPQCVEYPSPSDPALQKRFEACGKQINVDLLDLIELTSSEIEGLLDLPSVRKVPRNLALPEFRMAIRDEAGIISLSFKESTVKDLHFRAPADFGTFFGRSDKIYTPLIDLHYSDRTDFKTQLVFNIFYTSINDERDEFQPNMCWSLRKKAGWTAGDKVQGLLKAAPQIFLGVQRLFYEKPELWTKAKTIEVVEPPKVQHRQKKKSAKKSKVKIVRQVRLLPEDITSSATKSSRVITCPCWGVSGHYRVYKSGKRIWIEPYRKGKKRNDPNAYVTKEYQPVTSEVE